MPEIFHNMKDVVQHLESAAKEMQAVIDECLQTRSELQAGIDATDKRQMQAELHRQALTDALKTINQTMPVETVDREELSRGQTAMAYGKASAQHAGTPRPVHDIANNLLQKY